ncbi:MAG TPA: hypothetical protein VGJ72_02405 [Polaromonas sp.]|jgi:hypothetical protein
MNTPNCPGPGQYKVRELRGKVDPVVDMLASKARKLARQSPDMASQAKDRAQQSLNHAAGAATQHVSKQPLRSVPIAAAVGAAGNLEVVAAFKYGAVHAIDAPGTIQKTTAGKRHDPHRLFCHGPLARQFWLPQVDWRGAADQQAFETLHHVS